MSVIFIAGPFRADSAWGIEQNIRRAEEAALTVWLSGHVALCPHTNTRFFQGAAPDSVWLAGDLELLMRCDVVLLIRGWQNSEGAIAEKQKAESVGIPVYERLEDLLDA